MLGTKPPPARAVPPSDAQVADGWLQPLVTLLAKDTSLGAVGARIVQHDGRLASAGEIVWQDGTCEVYGHNGDPLAPEYTYVREVDSTAVNGLAVRRRAFEQLVGFDPSLAGTAYVGADFCFRLREFQPLATVVEAPRGESSAETESSTYAEAHRAFVARHGQALTRQRRRPAHGRVTDTRRARDRRPGKQVLVVDHIVPLHDQDSGSVRMAAILRMLGELGHHVTFMPDNLYAVEPYTTELRQSGVEVICGDHGADYVARHAGDFDVAILCRAHFAPKYLPAFLSLPQRPLIIFDTVDLHFVREERQAALEGSATLEDAAKRTRATELGIMRSCDRVWVTSTFEASLLQAEKGLPPVDIVPNVHSVHAGSVPSFAEREHFLFIGGFWHAPNEDAVMYFVNEIFPLVRAELPDVTFFVVGSNMPTHIAEMSVEGVVSLGHVPDVAPLFASCRLSIAPLRYGAGVKGKVTQSLALGLPVVATSIAAEGLDLVDGEHIAVADDPASFARRLVELYRSETVWTRLSTKGRHHIAQRLGYDAVKASVAAMIDGDQEHVRAAGRSL
jgi:O-antigen biosynthesis protein